MSERLVLYPPASPAVIEREEAEYGGMRVVAPFMRGAFIKQSRLHMQDFKAFAEHGFDVREAKD